MAIVHARGPEYLPALFRVPVFDTLLPEPIESGSIMTRHSSIGLGAASLFVLLLTASAAGAIWESDIEGARSTRQVVAISCDVSDGAVVTEVCSNVLMRWRLCERGFLAERLSTAGLYGCFSN